MHAKSADKNEALDLYRFMSGVSLEDVFLKDGGTELAPMSTTKIHTIMHVGI